MGDAYIESILRIENVAKYVSGKSTRFGTVSIQFGTEVSRGAPYFEIEIVERQLFKQSSLMAPLRFRLR